MTAQNSMNSLIKDYQARIQTASEKKQPLRIRAGGSKDFYGNPVETSLATPLDVSGYKGVIDYEPKELVLTVRAGTLLVDLEKLVDDAGQMLPFEPPHFSPTATIGGTVACGFSGPRRPYAGPIRDFVLGTRIINGKAEDLQFGGRVIKNVAGYDVSRLMVGALGTLGVLLDISFKVLPKPQAQLTLQFEMDEARAITTMNEWAGKPLPLSATSFFEGVLRVRLSGAQVAVDAARAKLGGELVSNGEAHWLSIKEHTHAYFALAQANMALWRVSVPTTSPATNEALAIDGQSCLVEWGGGLRWIAADINAITLREKVNQLGGHATLFRANSTAQNTANTFHPLETGVAKIHRRLKDAFDPAGIFNAGRYYDFPNL